MKNRLENFNNLGVWTAFGSLLGTLIFIITKEAYWIGIGVAMGVSMGAAFSGCQPARKTASSKEKSS